MKNLKLEKRIKSYFVLAMGVVGIGNLNAQIVYKDPPDKMLLLNEDTAGIRFDNDPIVDYIIKKIVWSPGQTIVILPQSGNSIIGESVYPTALALNDPIVAANPNWLSLSIGYMQGSYLSSYWGNFGDSQDHYIGCKFKIGSQNHYGWIRVGDIPSSASQCSVKDWAYNSVPDAPINAGQTTIIGIDNNLPEREVTFTLMNNQLAIDNLLIGCKSFITITNSIGQEMEKVFTTDTKIVIDLNSCSPGIYMVSVNNGKQQINRKIRVK